MNLPNKITVGRFFLSVAYFVALAVLSGSGPLPAPLTDVSRPLLWDLALLLFLVASVSDIVDGYVARRYNQVTDFGRVTDPFVDKIIICGSCVFFLQIPALQPLLPAWMVVVILTREFLVHGIRSLMESRGIPFAATWWGKQKMAVQSIAVGACLLYVGHGRDQAWSAGTLQAAIWVMVVSTVASGIAYLHAARALFQARNL